MLQGLVYTLSAQAIQRPEKQDIEFVPACGVELTGSGNN